MSVAFSDDQDININFVANPIYKAPACVVESNSDINLNVNNINKSMTYIKLVSNINIPDTNIDSDGFSSTVIVINIKYSDENIIYNYFPKYEHELNGDDYTIIKAPAGTINSINIKVINNENLDINLNKLEIYYAYNEVNKEDLEEYISDTIGDITSSGGNIIYDETNGLRYLVPEFTMAEWEAVDKSIYNECIIIGE